MRKLLQSGASCFPRIPCTLALCITAIAGNCENASAQTPPSVREGLPFAYPAEAPAALIAAQASPIQDSDLDRQDFQVAPGSVYPFSPYSPSEAGAARRYNTLAQNYNVPAIGPRAYADYAMSQYYPTDYQTVPGQPLYLRLSPPAQSGDGDLGNYVLRGPVPGSYLVPGTNTAFRFSGFVRMGANYTFDQMGTPDLFVTNTIPVPQNPNLPDQNVNFSARPTRLSLDTWTPSSFHDWTVHTFIQFDFLSDNPPAVGSSARPRLRFAFIDLGYFRIGQDTTVFMDPSSFPRTADFQGPNGVVNVRQGVIRMTLPVTEQVYWAAAAEQPFSDITTDGTGINVQDVPDFTSHLRYEGDLVRFQVAGILRTIGYQPTGGSVDRELGYGGNITSNYHPWAALMGTNPFRDDDPDPLTRSRVIMQYATGTGIARYFQDSAALGLDGAIDLNGDFQTLGIEGWTLAYEHWLSRKWLANFVFSGLNASGTNASPPTAFNSSRYVAAGLWWIPVGNASIGAEYLWGERENLDGQSRDAQRFQTAFVYSF